MLAIKTILHPTDFSESSSYAMDLAHDLASDYGANLVILHVMASPAELSDGVVFLSPERGADRADAIDTRNQAPLAKPAAEILHMAHLCNADLIVMGSHGQQPFRQCVMGSVAEAVTRRASCPVLTVTSKTKPVLQNGYLNSKTSAWD